MVLSKVEEKTKVTTHHMIIFVHRHYGVPSLRRTGASIRPVTLGSSRVVIGIIRNEMPGCWYCAVNNSSIQAVCIWISLQVCASEIHVRIYFPITFCGSTVYFQSYSINFPSSVDTAVLWRATDFRTDDEWDDFVVVWVKSYVAISGTRLRWIDMRIV